MNKHQQITTLLKLRNFGYEEIKIDFERSINLLFTFVQNFRDAEPELLPREVYIESLLNHISTCGKSILTISKPTTISVSNKTATLIDYPSILTLTRSVFEAFLTLEYLYLNDLTVEEKEFRFELWRMAGYLLRQNAALSSEKFEEKLHFEKEKIDISKHFIKSHKLYSTLTKTDIWKLDKYGLPRTISWSNLFELSKLNTQLYYGFYQLYSNYAHSEFVAMMQINEMGFNAHSESVTEYVKSALVNLRIINFTCLSLLKNFNDVSAEIVNDLGDQIDFEMKFWEGFCS